MFCCGSPGVSSPQWTLKVLLTYQVLIGHDIKHIHLLQTFSIVLVSCAVGDSSSEKHE